MKQKKIKKKEKEKIYDKLVKLVKAFDKKEKYQYQDRDDLDYFEIKGIKNLFDNVDVDEDNYYKPILIKSSFKNNYKYYESKGIEAKTYQ